MRGTRARRFQRKHHTCCRAARHETTARLSARQTIWPGTERGEGGRRMIRSNIWKSTIGTLILALLSACAVEISPGDETPGADSNPAHDNRPASDEESEDSKPVGVLPLKIASEGPT